MRFEVTILGCGSATPASKRNPSAQIVNHSERFFLIDCGEGTQMQIRKCGIRFQKINHIFISHLHGDHYLGLVGLISTLHLLGRKNDLHLYCHNDLKQIIDIQLKASDTQLNFEIIYHFLSYQKSTLIYEDNQLMVKTIVLDHRIPCCGFLFEEKPRLPSLKKTLVEYYQLQPWQILDIKYGKEIILDDGQKINPAKLIEKKHDIRKYAYCSDTRYNENIISIIKGCNLLYHEATFTEELKSRAITTFHSTAKDAAEIASKAEVKKLLLGHFSARYNSTEGHYVEAKTIFESTEIAVELKSYEV
jgi:ribonuclease Z